VKIPGWRRRILASTRGKVLALLRVDSHTVSCLVHKTVNILDKLPKSVQAKAKQLIHEMYLAPTRKAALAAHEQFISSYQVKFPKACECLQKDKETLFTFYDFRPSTGRICARPIRSNRTSRLSVYEPIEPKVLGSRIATLTMVFKLTLEAQKHWRRLQHSNSSQKSSTASPLSMEKN
jgi:putative transposase